MRCPICRKSVADDEPDRPATYPFCSERCKVIDLGRWLDGKYQVPVRSEDEAEDPGPGVEEPYRRGDG
jgi:uncharacterized protein